MSNLQQKIEEVLDKEIRPSLSMHGGGVEIEKINEEKGEVILKFSGMCHGCPAAGMTFYGLVEKELKDKISELNKIEMV